MRAFWRTFSRWLAGLSASAFLAIVAVQTYQDYQRKKAELKHLGGHCVDPAWPQSVAANRYIRARLRNPDSFQHVRTLIGRIDTLGRHEIRVRFRAENGFGGMNAGLAVGALRSSDCSVVTLKIES